MLLCGGGVAGLQKLILRCFLRWFREVPFEVMRTLIHYIRVVGVMILLSISTLVVFDLGCFFVLPEKFSSQIFLGYRVGYLPDGSLGRGYPHDYFEAHPERGFDIGISKSRREHALFDYPRNYVYPIWSNSLGCFD